MTNTYMLSGDARPEDIVAEVKDGIYAVGFGAGRSTSRTASSSSPARRPIA
jgi:predicted Zn-dependent protease